MPGCRRLPLAPDRLTSRYVTVVTAAGRRLTVDTAMSAVYRSPVGGSAGRPDGGVTVGLRIFGCGTKQYSRTLQKGTFECPRCQQAGREGQQEFKLESWKNWITLVYIPVIPMSGFEQVTCKSCHGQFAPNVIPLQPATPAAGPPDAAAY